MVWDLEWQRIGDVSKEIKRVRAQMEENEQVAILMRGLRGQNLSDSQFADENIQLRLVEVCVLLWLVICISWCELSLPFGFVYCYNVYVLSSSFYECLNETLQVFRCTLSCWLLENVAIFAVNRWVHLEQFEKSSVQRRIIETFQEKHDPSLLCEQRVFAVVSIILQVLLVNFLDSWWISLIFLLN